MTDIEHTNGAHEVELRPADIDVGAFFGEMALLTGEPRSADVTALDYCKFLTLSRRDFQQLVKKYPSIREQVVARASERGAMNRTLIEKSLAEAESSGAGA